MAKMSFRRELMAKMKIARVYSQMLKLEAVSQRLRMTAEVVLGAVIENRLFPADAASLSDLIGLLLGKIATDSVGTTDQAIFSIAKGLEDTVSISEIVGFDVSKPFSDAYVVIELIGVNLSKTLADSVSMTDSVLELLLTEENAFDSGSVSDTNTLTFGKAPQDTAITADIQTFDITKGLSDLMSFSDSVVLSASYVRSVADAASAQDIQASLVGKVKFDTLGIDDSGVLYSQNYVDNNLYFADDYVGEKRIF